MNVCGACGEDFNGVEMFERRRVGKHAYTFKEGMAMNPPLFDGRRCLAVSEMQERAWTRNSRG